MKGELIRLATRLQGPGLTDEAYDMPKRMGSLAANVPEPVVTVNVPTPPHGTPVPVPRAEAANQATEASS